MPSEKRVVYDADGNRQEAFPVDAAEIIEQGGSYDAPKTPKTEQGQITRIPIDPQAANATETTDERGNPVVVEGTVTPPLTEAPLRGRAGSGAAVVEENKPSSAKDAKK